jgi:hypothetical protein
MAFPAMNKLVKAAVLAGAAALFIYHFAMESATLRLSEPMGYPEIVYRTIAEVWPHQYQLGNFVATQDNYGPGFSTFCRLFFAMGMGPYVGARVANLAALLGAAAILVGILRSSRISWTTVAAVTSIFFALNAGSSSIQARPDFLATLLIMACLAMGRPAFLGRLNAASGGIVLGLLGLAAFLTKPYCLLAWGIAATFPFVAEKEDRRLGRAAAVIGISALVIALGVAAYAASNPYFLTETVMFHFAHRDPSLSVFLLQARDFCILGCGLVALVAVSIVRRSDATGETARATRPERRYWAFALLLGVAAMASGLGWHKGAYLTYYFHLVLPALAVCAAFACERLAIVFSGLALLANCVVLMAIAPSLPGPDKDWDALAMDVAGQRGPIVVDYMLEPLVQGRADARVAGDGINRFAIDLPDLIGGQSGVIRGARQEVRDYIENERAVIRKGPDPEAIYMDCILFPVRPGDTRVQPHGYIAVPRNDHPLILNGYDMSRYEPLRLFVIHPFYGSQNSARQDAGKWILTIVKFVRVDDQDAKGRPPRLPLVLVPPVN